MDYPNQEKNKLSWPSLFGGIGAGSALATGFNYVAEKAGHFQGLEGAVGYLFLNAITIPLSVAGAASLMYAFNNDKFNKKTFAAGLLAATVLFGGRAAIDLTDDIIDYVKDQHTSSETYGID